MAKKKSRQSSKKPQSDTTIESFQSAVSVALSSGTATIAVSPNTSLSLRSSGVADTYSLYKLKTFAFRLRRSGTLNGPMVLCYIPGVTDTLPSTISTAAETLHRCIITPVETVPTAWVHVPSQVLHGMQEWYKTIVGTPDAAAEILGNLQLVGSGSDTSFLEIKGTFEFMSPIAQANTPAALAARKIIRDENIRIARENAARAQRQLASIGGPSQVGQTCQ